MPKARETIWIPVSMEYYEVGCLHEKFFNVYNDFPNCFIKKGYKLGKIADNPVINMCKRHWSSGESWEQVGAYVRMEQQLQRDKFVDGCRSMDEVKKRFEHLDNLYEICRDNRRLLSSKENGSLFPREAEGVLFHIGKGGVPIFGKVGQHRLAIALALGLEYIPARLGIIDSQSLFYLPNLRMKP